VNGGISLLIGLCLSVEALVDVSPPPPTRAKDSFNRPTKSANNAPRNVEAFIGIESIRSQGDGADWRVGNPRFISQGFSPTTIASPFAFDLAILGDAFSPPFHADAWSGSGGSV